MNERLLKEESSSDLEQWYVSIDNVRAERRVRIERLWLRVAHERCRGAIVNLHVIKADILNIYTHV